MTIVCLYLAELGRMTEVLDLLELAKTQKDYKKAETMLRSYCNSIQAMRNVERISAAQKLFSIVRTFTAGDKDVMYEFYWGVGNEFI